MFFKSVFFVSSVVSSVAYHLQYLNECELTVIPSFLCCQNRDGLDGFLLLIVLD